MSSFGSHIKINRHHESHIQFCEAGAICPIPNVERKEVDDTDSALFVEWTIDGQKHTDEVLGFKIYLDGVLIHQAGALTRSYLFHEDDQYSGVDYTIIPGQTYVIRIESVCDGGLAGGNAKFEMLADQDQNPGGKIYKYDTWASSRDGAELVTKEFTFEEGFYVSGGFSGTLGTAIRFDKEVNNGGFWREIDTSGEDITFSVGGIEGFVEQAQIDSTPGRLRWVFSDFGSKSGQGFVWWEV